MSRKSFLVAAIVALAATSAQARSEFTLVQSKTAPEYAFKADIIGFTPGMSAADAETKMTERYPEGNIQLSTTYVGNDNVHSDSFKSRFSMWKREKEEINVLLTSPSAGNQVFAVSRNLEYWDDEARPDIDETISALKAKYGEPNYALDARPKANSLRKDRIVTLAWYLGGNGKCDLKQFDSMMRQVSEICTNEVIHKTGPQISTVSYNPGYAKYYAQLAQAGADVILVAKVSNHDNSSRAFNVRVSFMDLKRPALSVEGDAEQIEAAQKAFDSVKVAAPEL